MLELITPVVLTYNEAANIGRTLDALSWARRVIVLDSGSSDDTEAIARSFVNVQWHVRAFDDHATQCNHALDRLAAGSAWVLFLDADYQVTPAAAAEIDALAPSPAVCGYEARFVYCVDGAPLRGALYPPRVVLFRPERAHYVQEGHTQRLRLDGEVRTLGEPLLHDDRKQTTRFLANQRRYAALEAKWLWSRPFSMLRWSERARRLLVLAPWLVPAVVLLWRGGWRDGRRGLRYAGERAVAEMLIAWALFKRMLQRNPSS
jgi:glycosyltransferase involved in cell wall biosynthesis